MESDEFLLVLVHANAGTEYPSSTSLQKMEVNEITLIPYNKDEGVRKKRVIGQ